MERKPLFQKWKTGLGKTRTGLLARLFSSKDGINEAFYEELEEALILADAGAGVTERLLDELQAVIKEQKISDRAGARKALAGLIAKAVTTQKPFSADTGEAVVLIVGVNGVGKTTSIGKLANSYREQGRKIMLAAADTFRAAAAEQLGEWAKRADVAMVRHNEGADPAAVVFDAIASYKAKGCDLLLCDTAGRLHNKANLMNELGKIRRVIARELPDTPCETLLVLDAVTGQNAVAQARAFAEVCQLDGVILTKLDGTAKGGVVISICETLKVPVRFVGVGEGIDDLQPFNAELFAEALLGNDAD
ncbi:Signal recognition particle receptor FtsY [bioreactor metagenome]|mgnify:FL=1|uniref:Signal recognition particle receptor FtsY n=1 Tax=bioreactor metagenome TaxID=1076179 RepID=A0A644ZUY9_9ZZZZ